MKLKTCLISVLLVGVELLSCSANAQQLITVSRQPVTETLVLQGVIEAVNQSTVSAQTAGTIIELPVDVDDAVGAGQLIVRLDDTEQRARVNRAQANLESAQATLTDAIKRARRIVSLHQQGVASEAERDEAETLVETHRARLAEAEAALDEAQKQLTYTQIRAPYAGIVTERFVDLGESVQPGQRLMSGLSLEQLRVVTALPQQYADYVRHNRSASIVTDDGRELPIASMTFYPYADKQSHTFRLRLNLNNPDGRLFPGELVNVNIAVGQRDALLVPKAAVAVRGSLRAVYVATEDEEPQLRQVRVGQHRNGQIEILSGLVAGERIITVAEAVLNEQ